MSAYMWGFFTAVLVAVERFFYWFRKKKMSVVSDILVSEKIYLILKRLIDDTGADRISIFQFHNGNYFYTGNSIEKMTNTHEVALQGISREQVVSCDMMVAPYRSMLSGMIKNEIYSVVDIDDAGSYNEKAFFYERGAMSSHMILIKDKSEKLLGFICVDFVKKTSDLNDYGVAILKQASVAIYELLVFGESKK